MSFLRRWLSQRERVPTTDTDVEAGLPATVSPASSSSSSARVTPASIIGASESSESAIELSGSTAAREEEGMVVVLRPNEPGAASAPNGAAEQSRTPGASGGADIVSPERTMIAHRLLLVRRVSQFLILLTVLQVMSTLGTEHIHFLSLFSLFVPWTGFEGAKEMNPAYIRVFYWGCFIMIPANFFHYLSFDQFAQELMAAGLEDNLRRELVFNHTLFNVVTIAIIVLMSMCIAWIRQLNTLVMLARINGETDSFIMGARAVAQSARQHTGPLSAEEISAISAFKLGPEDLTVAGGGDKEVCVICQDEYQINDLAKRLNCRHMFHATCIDSWLERSSACPICNGDVRSIV